MSTVGFSSPAEGESEHIEHMSHQVSIQWHKSWEMAEAKWKARKHDASLASTGPVAVAIQMAPLFNTHHGKHCNIAIILALGFNRKGNGYPQTHHTSHITTACKYVVKVIIFYAMCTLPRRGLAPSHSLCSGFCKSAAARLFHESPSNDAYSSHTHTHKKPPSQSRQPLLRCFGLRKQNAIGLNHHHP